MLKLILTQYLFCLSAGFLTYCAGKVIVSLIKVRNLSFLFRLFLTNMIGLTVIVLVFSIAKTNFRTINLLLIPFIILLLIHFKNKIAFNLPNYKLILKELINLLLVVSCFFIYQLLFVVDFKLFELKSLFSDFNCYSSYAENLKINGFENTLTEMSFLFPETFKGNSPYHYPELWLNSFYSDIFKNSTLNSYYFSVIPILLSIYFTGLFSIVKMKIQSINKYYQILLSISLLFITTIFFPFKQHFLEGYPFITNFSIMGFGPKLLFIYLFLLLGIFLLMSGYKKIGFIVILLIPIFSISFLPGIYCGVLLYIFISYLRSRFVLNVKSLQMGIFIFFIMISFYCFYKFNSHHLTNDALNNSTNGSVFTRLPDNLNSQYTFQNFKIFIGNFFTYYLPGLFYNLFNHLKSLWIGFLFYSPFLLLLFSVCKTYKTILFLIFSILFSGSIAVVIADGVLNKGQFFTNLSAFVSVFIVLGHIELFTYLDFNKFKNRIIVFSLIILQIFFCAYPTILEKLKGNKEVKNLSFIKEIRNELDGNRIVILEFFGSRDFEPIHFENWINYNDLKMLNQISDKTILYLLGNPEEYLKLNKLTNESNVLYNSATPINYWRSLDKSNNLKNFIKKFKIKYCYFKKDAVVPLFIENLAKKIILDQSKNRFYILN